MCRFAHVAFLVIEDSGLSNDACAIAERFGIQELKYCFARGNVQPMSLTSLRQVDDVGAG